MALGERIKACRLKAGMSQEKVAEQMGVSRQAVTKWESGQTSPSTENLFKLAELFGTSVDLLLSDDAPPGESVAGQVHALYRAEGEKQAAARRRNLLAGAGVAAGYLLVYLIGRLICGDLSHSSLLGWLTGTDSKYYLFGWLTHQRVFWVAMVLSVLPALFGKYRFSIVTLAGFVLGIFVGELLGPNPAGAAIGQTHLGWLIWGGVFLASAVLGILREHLAGKKQKNG